jgi:hypothetical protein
VFKLFLGIAVAEDERMPTLLEHLQIAEHVKSTKFSPSYLQNAVGRILWLAS